MSENLGKFTINNPSPNEEELSKHTDKFLHIRMHISWKSLVWSFSFFLPLIHCGLWFGRLGLQSCIWFGFLSLMYLKAVIFVSSFSFANKTPRIYCRDLLYFIPPFRFFIFPLHPGWLELAVALPILWRNSCKANDVSRGSIFFCRKMSKNILKKWTWLRNMAVHY